MLRLFQYLFFGHVHKWVLEGKMYIWQPGTSEEKGNRPIGTSYVLRCEICGDIKERKFV